MVSDPYTKLNDISFVVDCVSFFLFHPPFQSPQQDPIGQLGLPIRLRVFYKGVDPLYPGLCAQLSQLLAGKLSSIVRYQVPQNLKTEHNVLLHKMLDFVGGYLFYRFSFNPLSKVVNGDNEVFHLAYGQREMAQNVYPSRMERP